MRVHTMRVHTMRELGGGQCTPSFKHASRRRDLQQGEAGFRKKNRELNCSPKNELFARKSN